MSQTLAWGILGTGNIARQFATGVKASRRGRLAAVGSRTSAAAMDFARQYAIDAAHGSYDELLADRNVDAIYLSLPNSMHHEWTTKALRAGKHVLCEKPISVYSREAEEMFDVAKQTGKLLIEAFMYRAHTQTIKAVEQIRAGAIGKVKLIRTSFCFRTVRIDGNIRFMPDLAGGSLMDVGCYCVNFSRMIAGQEPENIRATAHIHPTGVEDQLSGLMTFSSGITAEFTCGFGLQADNTAYVCGDEGYLSIPVPWKPVPGNGHFIIARGTPPRQDVPGSKTPATPPRQTIEADDDRDVYAVEADAFAACVLDGAPSFVTQQDSIGNMRTIEALRAAAGLVVGQGR